MRQMSQCFDCTVLTQTDDTSPSEYRSAFCKAIDPSCRETSSRSITDTAALAAQPRGQLICADVQLSVCMHACGRVCGSVCPPNVGFLFSVVYAGALCAGCWAKPRIHRFAWRGTATIKQDGPSSGPETIDPCGDGLRQPPVCSVHSFRSGQYRPGRFFTSYCSHSAD
uniref:Uncharacterized protein n=1 Tax=Setaria digitata TaxID=48799 RepID=A0A915PZQ2_9BILA